MPQLKQQRVNIVTYFYRFNNIYVHFVPFDDFPFDDFQLGEVPFLLAFFFFFVKIRTKITITIRAKMAPITIKRVILVLPAVLTRVPVTSGCEAASEPNTAAAMNCFIIDLENDFMIWI